MRIAILTAAVPFAASPVRRLAAELASALERCGHAALVVNLPRPAGPLPVEHVLAIRALRLPNVDRAIALGFPACAVRHASKVVWLPECLPSLVADFSCGAGSQPAAASQAARSWAGWEPAAAQGAAPLRPARGIYLREAVAVYTDSPPAALRLKQESGIEAELLIPPVPGASWREVAETLAQ